MRIISFERYNPQDRHLSFFSPSKNSDCNKICFDLLGIGVYEAFFRRYINSFS